MNENLIQDTLWIIKLSDLAKSLDAPSGKSLGEPSKLLSWRTSNETGAIANVQWLGEREIGFLAADHNGVRQAFAVELSGRSRQLTSSPTNVTAFAAMGSTILYYAVVAERRPQSFSVTSAPMDMGSIIDPSTHSELFPRVDLFVQIGREAARTVASSPIRLSPYYQSISISPDERFAVVMQPAIAWPAHWDEYQLPHMAIFQYSRSRATTDGTSLELFNRLQYRLVDIRNGASTPLLDAPTGLLSLNYTPAGSFWMSDSSSVVISSTFLPLPQATGAGRRQRARHPAIAEVRIPSRMITPIHWEPAAAENPSGGTRTMDHPIVALDFHNDELTVYSSTRSGGALATTDSNPVSSLRYSKANGQWKRLPEAHTESVGKEISVDVRQSLNERPKIYVSGGRCKCKKLLWDLNPHADRFSFGRVQVIEWTGSNGISWHGGLILPPDYQQGKRYPLVIQTHGFHTDEFLVDGPQGTTTTFAAQPLANAGFIVLQLEENASAATLDAAEPVRYAEGMRAVIKKLDRDGLIDARRVGAIGWSSTGSSVLSLLSDHPGTLAAAVVSDAVQFGYVPYLLGVNWPPSLREEFDRFAGISGITKDPAEVLARDKLHEWAPRAPPIRLEAIRASSLVGMWELYAVLRFANRPVDLIFFPEGSHSLQKPSERMGSQQGTVDWFRFWLQKEDLGDAAKNEQLQLWRGMRRALEGG